MMLKLMSASMLYLHAVHLVSTEGALLLLFLFFVTCQIKMHFKFIFFLSFQVLGNELHEAKSQVAMLVIKDRPC